jgi:hypothetical protein
MGIIHNLNFKIKNVTMILDVKYENLIKEGKIRHEDLNEIASKYNNVIKETNII